MRSTGNITPASWCRAIAALALVLLCGTVHSHTEGGPTRLYLKGVNLYQQSKYAEAKKALEKAVHLAPDVSSYHHWLGKAYGRMAENSGPFRAISLSRRALEKLETAVELDDDNIEAMRDLMEFYRQAPAFLGGSRKKAEELGRRINALESGDISRQDNLVMDPSS